MVTVTICSDFGAQENKIFYCFHFLPIYLPWSDWTGCHDLSFLNTEFQSSFFTLLFLTHHSGPLVPSHFLPLEWLSSLYLKLLVFLLVILIPACDLSTLAFHMMHSAYKLNKPSDNIQPCGTPFPILKQWVIHVQF